MTRNIGVVALIPARGGSKGVLRKNVKPLAGKPLISYSIETALKSNFIDRVIVSTEDQEIAEIARTYGAEVPFVRPLHLAQDDSPEWLTWQHAVQTLTTMDGGGDITALVCISPTAPLRSVEDVDKCIELYLSADTDIVITVKDSHRNPHFNMVVVNDNNEANLAVPLEKTFFRRQDVPKMYDVTTVAYVANPGFVLTAHSIFEGRVMVVKVPEERSIDIDTDLDFAFAEFLVKQDSANANY